MAQLGDKRKHVLFIDSRGSKLQDTLKKVGVSENDFKIFNHPGARLQKLVFEANEYAKKRPFDVIYIAGGINNVTTKCRITKVVTFEWQSEKALSEFLLTTMERSLAFLKREHPATKFIFCSIPGVQLEYVVPCPTIRDQEIVTNSIWNYNVAIRAENKKLNIYHPRLDRPIHRMTAGIRRNYYHHLGDGLHPTDFSLAKWTQELVKAMGYN